jgi:4-hydroxybenzoate polyprenyltransferase
MKDRAPAGESGQQGGPSAPPLCVDLDGTLVRSDLLWESLVSLLRRRPLRLARLPWWLGLGRAALKERIDDAARVDAASLPYNDELVERLRRERAQGRRLVLATASPERAARCVAEHLGLFDDVLASRDGRNLKGRAKRHELVRRFGERGFDYAGDPRADLVGGGSARAATAVDAPAAVLRRLGGRATRVIASPRRPLPRLIAEAIRLDQWIKNLLLVVPALLAHRLDASVLGRVSLGFLSFSLGASAVYVLNDLLDVEADRHHPVKRRRPFAAGELSLKAGLGLLPLLAAASLGVALLLPLPFLGVLAFYFGVTTLYSFRLKEIALLDVLVLASLFTTRILAGATAAGVEASPWLFAFSMFVFLSLAAVKRYAELLRLPLADGARTLERRGYRAGDREPILQMGVASGFMAVLVLALYITGEGVTRLYVRPTLLWLACPVLLYWVGRIWLLAHRGEVEDDPLMFAVRDRTTWIVAVIGGVLLLAASRWS